MPLPIGLLPEIRLLRWGIVCFFKTHIPLSARNISHQAVLEDILPG